MIVLRDLAPSALAFALELLVVGSAIALAVALAFAVARNAAPRLRYAIAVIAFFAAVIVPMIPRRAGVSPADQAEPALSEVEGSRRPVAAGTAAVQPARTPAFPDAPLAAYAVLAWLAVGAALVLREVAGHIALHFRRAEWDAAPHALRDALEWPGDVALHLADEGPRTIGLLQPRVILPAAWLENLTSDAAARVARHELAHARWRDPLVHALVRIVRALFWPSLPLWYLERVIRTEREVAADAFAVAWRGEPRDRVAVIADYASSLVDAAQRNAKRVRVATALGNGIGLEERVARLFAFTRPRAWRIASAAAILLAGAAATTALPAIESTAKPSLHPIPDRASAEYEMSARAMNDILDRTRFHNHESTPDVHQLLARIRASGTTQPLFDALRASDRRTRESVAWITGELRDPSLVPALVERLADSDPHVQQTAAWSLGMIGDARAIAPLIASLNAKDASARHGAAWALGRLHAVTAVDALIARLEDPSTDVQHGAAWSLGIIGDERAIPALELLHDRTWSRDVREETKRALIRFGRTPHS